MNFLAFGIFTGSSMIEMLILIVLSLLLISCLCVVAEPWSSLVDHTSLLATLRLRSCRNVAVLWAELTRYGL